MMPKPPLEKDVQRHVVQLYAAAGCWVYSLSQGYRPGGKGHGTTRQTKGLPDLYVMHSAGRVCWHETKRPGAVQSTGQRLFQCRANECNVDYVWGGYREALVWLLGHGLWHLPAGVTLDQVAPV